MASFIQSYLRQDIISRFTLDSASEFLFGHCVDSLSIELPYPYNVTKSSDVPQADDATQAFSRAFARAQQRINERLSIGQNWPLTEIFSDHTAQQMKVVNTFLDPILADAVAKHRANDKLDTSEFADDETLVDHLVKLTSGEIPSNYKIPVVQNIKYYFQTPKSLKMRH